MLDPKVHPWELWEIDGEHPAFSFSNFRCAAHSLTLNIRLRMLSGDAFIHHRTTGNRVDAMEARKALFS